MYEYSATITRVVDGDTVDCTVDLGFNLFKKVRFRILNIDTPETYRPRNEAEKVHGLAATARAEELLLYQTLLVETGKFGKYRWLASIVLADGRDYAAVMKVEGFEKRKSYAD